MTSTNEERDRGVCDMWNSGASVDAIGRRYHMTNGAVYAVVRRRRDRGYNVARRHSDECIHRRNSERYGKVKRRAFELELLANDGRIDVLQDVNAKTAAQVMDTSLVTLWRHARRGTLAHGRKGHMLRFKLCDLIDWAKSL